MFSVRSMFSTCSVKTQGPQAKGTHLEGGLLLLQNVMMMIIENLIAVLLVRYGMIIVMQKSVNRQQRPDFLI